MAQVTRKKISKFKRHLRIRKRVFGTADRPRLSVHRSLNHLHCQFIDDMSQKTLFAFSTQDKDFKKHVKKSGNVQAAVKLGELFGPKALAKGIKKISFDRGGNLYHGRIKALADSLRKAGIEF